MRMCDWFDMEIYVQSLVRINNGGRRYYQTINLIITYFLRFIITNSSRTFIKSFPSTKRQNTIKI